MKNSICPKKCSKCKLIGCKEKAEREFIKGTIKLVELFLSK